MDTRRCLMAAAALLCAALGIPQVLGGQGQDRPMPAPPPSQQEGPITREPKEGPTIPNNDKLILEANEKDIKKKVQRLYQLASELKTEVEKTDSSKVLSVALLKKAEEIEKLAKEIRNKSRAF